MKRKNGVFKEEEEEKKKLGAQNLKLCGLCELCPSVEKRLLS